MKEETKNWLKYAEENLEAAKLLYNSHLYNPSLHNIQQSVEKSLKSLFIEKGIKLKKSHSIYELNNILSQNGFNVNISDEECDLLDSIYIPSKYPLGSVLPDYEPEESITQKCISIAVKVLEDINTLIKD